jgi:aspartate aminotransferase
MRYTEFCLRWQTVHLDPQLPEYADRVICIDSFSKRYSMCGSRIGALVSKNREVLESG